MKSRAQVGALGLAILALVPFSNAAKLLAPRDSSLAAKAVTYDKKDMPITEHKKEAGSGYEKGSPLHEKQEARKVNGKLPPPPKAPHDETVALDPQGTDVTERHFRWQQAVENKLIERHFHGIVLAYYFFYFCTVVIQILVLGLIYDKCLKWRSDNPQGVTENFPDGERPNDAKGFAYGICETGHICDGGHHLWICACSFCFSPLRLADTWTKKPRPLIGFGFWGALILIACLLGLAAATRNFSVLILLIVAVWHRRKLRGQYDLPSGGCTLCEDLCCWIWCTSCVICQEARQVEFVRKIGSGPPGYNK